MRNIYHICRKEFGGYFTSPIAYIYITVFLVFSGWLFFRGFFLMNQATMREFFYFLPWIFLFLVPAATMRLWAEEKKLGTMEILMTLPLKDYEVVLGKFLASFIFLSLSLALTFPILLTVACLGNLDWGPAIGGYLGSILMGGAYLAIGIFISGLTTNQIVAFIVAIFVSFIVFIMGEDIVLSTLPEFLVPLFSYLGMGSHFSNMGKGLIDSRDLIYCLSVISFFIFLNIRSLATRRWK